MPNIKSIPLNTKELQRYKERHRIPQSLDIWQSHLATCTRDTHFRQSQMSDRILFQLTLNPPQSRFSKKTTCKQTSARLGHLVMMIRGIRGGNVENLVHVAFL